MKLATKPNTRQTEMTLSNDEVAERIVQVKEGCEDSVRVLMEFLFPVVAKIVNSRVRCRESKDDVTQETARGEKVGHRSFPNCRPSTGQAVYRCPPA